MAKQFSLGKAERLKSRKLIDQLFSDGKKFSYGSFRISYLLQKKPAGILFGTGTSAKSFKRAVDRNRIKRLVREAYRLQKNTLLGKISGGQDQLLVFFIYTGKEIPDFKTVYEAVGKILEKLEALLFKKP